MNYLEIFDDIINILHVDYSGCNDKKNWDNPSLYREKLVELLNNDMVTPEVFQELTNDYLLDFKDGHMYFRLVSNGSQKVYDNGFKCRRYEDKLYVTHTVKETRLSKGMAISALDGIPVSELVQRHHRQLHLLGDSYEREKWEPVILKYKTCTVLDNSGHNFEMNLNKYERELPVQEYSLKELPEGILLMKLTDFNDGYAISKLIEENEEKLEKSKGLIIDVRVNGGGSDSTYFKLLDYIFPEEMNLKDLDDGTVMTFNMTERNCNLRLELFKNYLTTIKDQATIDFINKLINQLEENRGKGFVDLSGDSEVYELIIHGRKNPEKVVVLSDVYCGSSGDAFVETVVKSKKVTYMGRATAGITDYSNLCIQEYENTFQLWYPTSRAGCIDIGKGLTGLGVQPHVHIPWTPEHLEEDVDLKKALEFLK